MNLADMTAKELEKELSVPTYKAKQIYKWIRRGETNADNMTDLSKELRKKIQESYVISWPTVSMRFVSKIDGTKKYLIKLSDGNVVETVLMSYEHGFSICISSQVGCRMGCRFCASTMDGLVRNLSPSEIEGQIRAVSEDSEVRIGSVVVMGIGEPFDNYENLIKALKAINNEDGLGIGLRHITVSTCGLPNGIKQFTSEAMPVTLAISLHAPNDEIRRRIMPVAKSVSVNELIDLADEYSKATKRRVTYEYALINGVNDSLSAAKELAEKLKGRLCHVNIIEVNPVKGRDFKRGKNKQEFLSVLEKNGIAATVRRELGADISASCGQLKKSVAEEG